MKRILLMVAVPIGLLVIWGINQSSDHATAKVDIAADQVTAMRGTVITRLEQVGATRVAETTSFDDGGSSDITFRLPAARIEQALVEVDQLGGTVTDQQVDLRSASDSASSITDRLGSLQSCLDTVATDIRAGTAAGRKALTTCQSSLRQVNSDMSASPVSIDDAELAVHIHPTSGGSGLAVGVAAILVVGITAMSALLLRSRRRRDQVDLRGPAPTVNPLEDDELYQRRN